MVNFTEDFMHSKLNAPHIQSSTSGTIIIISILYYQKHETLSSALRLPRTCGSNRPHVRKRCTYATPNLRAMCGLCSVDDDDDACELTEPRERPRVFVQIKIK